MVFSVFLLLFLPFSSSAADFWLEGQATQSNAGKGVSQVNAGISGNIAHNIGYFVFAQAYTDGYKQIYGGPTIKLFPWLELGVGIGRESVDNGFRRAVYFSITNSPFSASGVFETGAPGHWHKVVAIYSVTEKVGLGLMRQRYLGFGPRAEYALGKSDTLWVGVLRDSETDTKNLAVGLIHNFF